MSSVLTSSRLLQHPFSIGRSDRLQVRAAAAPAASPLPVTTPLQGPGNAVKKLMAGKEFLRWYDDKAIQNDLPKAQEAYGRLLRPRAMPAYVRAAQPKSWSDVANQETDMAQRNLQGLALRQQYALHWGTKHPIVLQRFDKHSGVEIKHARHARAFLVRQLIEALRQAMGHSGTAAALRGVDLGCGTGRTTRLVSQAFGPRARMTGIDACCEALAWGTTHATFADKHIEFRHGLLEDLPLSQQSQDFATALWSLEDMPLAAQVAAVRQTWHALKPGGVLAVLTQSKPQHKCVLQKLAPPPLSTPMDETLRSCGFEDVVSLRVAEGHTVITARKP